mgnify:CR=1 FL=1
MSAVALLTVDLESNGVVPDASVFALIGELDVSTADTVTRELAQAEALRDRKLIVLDLRQLNFIDSTGLRVVLEASQSTSDRGQRFVLLRGTQAVQRVFELTRAVDRLEFFDSPEELAASL